MLGEGCKVQMLLTKLLDNPLLADDIMHATERVEMMAATC